MSRLRDISEDMDMRAKCRAMRDEIDIWEHRVANMPFCLLFADDTKQDYREPGKRGLYALRYVNPVHLMWTAMGSSIRHFQSEEEKSVALGRPHGPLHDAL